MKSKQKTGENLWKLPIFTKAKNCSTIKCNVFCGMGCLYYVGRSFCYEGEMIRVVTGEKFIYIYFYNGAQEEAEDPDVAELMGVFKNSQGQNEKFYWLTNRVHDLKNNESEVNDMCELVEEYAKEYVKEYAKEYVKTLICELVHEGKLSAEDGAQKIGIPMTEFVELMKQFGYTIPEPA